VDEHSIASGSTDLRLRPSSRALAVSLVVNVEEGAEMSVADGDRGPEPVDEMGLALRSPVRNTGNESNYAYGLKEGLHRVVRVFDAAGVPVTWTCAAVALERAPEVARTIVRRGDEAASHGYRWVHQYRMDEDEERRFLVAARDSITASVGTAPAGHLSRYLFTERTRELLVQEGFRYHMDDYSADEPFWSATPSGPIVVVPYAIDTNDMKMWANAAYTPQMWLQYATDTFDQLYRERREGFRTMSVGLHLRIIGRPGRIRVLEQFLDHVLSHEDVWPVTRGSLAAAFAAASPSP
jgi:peptidoglycan/xylan/chitin deacetylase (PgdA/CDA1 family)